MGPGRCGREGVPYGDDVVENVGNDGVRRKSCVFPLVGVVFGLSRVGSVFERASIRLASLEGVASGEGVAFDSEVNEESKILDRSRATGGGLGLAVFAWGRLKEP